MSPLPCRTFRRYGTGGFRFFSFQPSRFRPSGNFFYRLIEVIFSVRCEMVKHAQALTKIFKILKAPERDDLVYLSLQDPGLPLT